MHSMTSADLAPRSGAIYVAQRVSVGEVGFRKTSRGAATSRQSARIDVAAPRLGLMWAISQGLRRGPRRLRRSAATKPSGNFRLPDACPYLPGCRRSDLKLRPLRLGRRKVLVEEVGAPSG